MSQQSIDRRFDWSEDHGIHRRAEIKPSTDRKNVGDCPLCGLPVYVSPGQIITRVIDKFGEWHPSHKSCRKESKK